MTSRTIRAALAAAALTAVAAAPLAAQGASPITFNLRAGAAVPTGESADFVEMGFAIGGGLSFRPATLPFALRFDGDFNRFGYDSDVIGVDDANFNVWSITANAELAPATSPIYFVGGVGFYSMNDSFGGNSTDSETELGFNAGGGFRLPLTGFNTFVEARFHSIATEGENINYIPIVFGLSF